MSKKAPKPAPAAVKPPKMLFLLIFVGLVLLVPVLIEAALQFSGAGVPTQPFKQVSSWPGVYTDDPDGFRKYYPKFGSSGASDAIRQNIFQVPRPEGTLRGIVLGESTAQGFPFLRNQSWGKLAQAALNQAHPTSEWEILNLGRAAMTSYYVRDLAPKLTDYQPDFLVVYAGHNEYYGTVSQSTGSTHFLRNLYLQLKEYKLFQLMFEALTPNPPKAAGTRMAQQFADKLLPADRQTDAEVAANFVDNLDQALRPWIERKVPVIVYEPVSNLGMPPFVTSLGDNATKTKIDDLLKKWQAALKAGDQVTIQACRQELAGQSGQPGVQFLEAETRRLAGEQGTKALYTQAKDLDPSPFRARTALVEALGRWADELHSRYPNLIYVRTGSDLEARYGQDAWQGKLFIDHLHFNFEGQRALASLLIEALGRVYPLNQRVAEAQKLLEDDAACRQAVSLTSLWNYRAIHGVEKLLAFAPYNTMTLAPDFGLAGLKAADPLYADTELVTALDKAPEDELFNTAMGLYVKRQDAADLSANLFALAWINPGAAESHAMMGDYFVRAGKTDQAADAYKKAYRLSGNSPALAKKLQSVGGTP